MPPKSTAFYLGPSFTGLLGAEWHTRFTKTLRSRERHPPPYGNPDLDRTLMSLGVSHKAQAAPREPGVADSRGQRECCVPSTRVPARVGHRRVCS